MGGVLLAASMGFDERPVTHAMVDMRPCCVALFVPRVGGEAQRLEDALSFVRRFAGALGARLEVYWLDVGHAGLEELVYMVKERVRGLLGECGVDRVVFVPRAGLRVLTVALTVAAMGLALELGQGVTLLLWEESIGTVYEADAASLAPAELGGEERRVLRLLAKRTLEGYGLTVREAAELLGAPRSTVHRRLQALAEKGLAYRAEDGYRATPRGIASA
ncbi:MAG TPA: winged helix-turn-helix transcriptional regulator [Pyrodictium sp.]|nr:winged helix-turn-helix transcriptional regulator [Pyrodictium sp.]